MGVGFLYRIQRSTSTMSYSSDPLRIRTWYCFIIVLTKPSRMPLRSCFLVRGMVSQLRMKRQWLHHILKHLLCCTHGSTNVSL